MARKALTRERIVQAAIELLDSEGLEGLNMRTLGDRLNSAATAVYWHVQNKDNLVELAGDQVWHEVELPSLEEHSWRAAGMLMARSEFEMMVRHPWLVQALGTHLMGGRGKARHDDHTLNVYEQAGFVGAQADQAAATVFTFVLGNALGEAAGVSLRRRLNREGTDADQLISNAMAHQGEIAMEFPRLRARLAVVTDEDYSRAPDQSFEFGLEAIFDGLQNQLADFRPATGED
ncbi:TetR/AcrR family transcriptional regulator C-terminal domain-containing protein [Kineosporia sp. J2-2]|uniref:TetR/AcrR family transcriptional regulator C-terminal domain-containing protein n=1 Tax=Kineosporia corallincola TaxID=2835133 RepID=A0ABS5TK91_9ACTN|nr:TetR/AcrR family transcriptional regulator [Kineosporia corallincola]MBT0770606.1 TetR/AcrR family transcriptional regulator C-terminal domain-containing protein [Kineosporia corallincola]